MMLAARRATTLGAPRRDHGLTPAGVSAWVRFSVRYGPAPSSGWSARSSVVDDSHRLEDRLRGSSSKTKHGLETASSRELCQPGTATSNSGRIGGGAPVSAARSIFSRMLEAG